jgi:hypothetical protein
LSQVDVQPDREQVADTLFERLGAAANEYYAALGEYRKVVEEFGDMLDQPEGTSALQQAARRERDANQNYRAALNAIGMLFRE